MRPCACCINPEGVNVGCGIGLAVSDDGSLPELFGRKGLGGPAAAMASPAVAKRLHGFVRCNVERCDVHLVQAKDVQPAAQHGVTTGPWDV